MSLLIILLIITACKFTTMTGIHIKAHFNPSNNLNYPRIRMAETLSSLQQFTICSWLKLYSTNNDMLTVISYATLKSDNQIVITLNKYHSDRLVRFHIGDPYLEFKCNYDWVPGQWYYLCASWFSATATAKVYQNGQSCTFTRSHLNYPKTPLPSGGILVIGQEQDALDSKYDANQAWHGDIADVHIWDEELSPNQIFEAGQCKGGRKEGNVFSWMKSKIIVTDNVEFSETELCYS
ncbi:C-reactive protein 1.1-like [Centruroides vittatus]|uniref:C-reactive protein 1.1-like n=1 Tax=Centruroides vittatus TaxID=120091 RepID=UPI00350F8B81